MLRPLSNLRYAPQLPSIPDPTKPGDPGGTPQHGPGSGEGGLGDQGEGGPQSEPLDPHVWEQQHRQQHYASSSPLGYRLNALLGHGYDVGGRLVGAARHGQLSFEDLPPSRYPATDPFHAGELIPNQATMTQIDTPWGKNFQLGSGERVLRRLQGIDTRGDARAARRTARQGSEG